MYDDEPLDDLFVSLTLNFSAIRVVQRTLVPSKWTVKADVIQDEELAESDPNYDFNCQVAFAKVRFWFDQILDGSLLIERDNEWAQRAFLTEDGKQSVGNHLVLLPTSPHDAVLAEIIQSKMNALAGNYLTFGTVELSSDDSSGLSYVFIGVGEFNLPEMAEWAGDPNYFSKPWWARNDASTIDVMPGPDTDFSKPPAFAYSLDFIADAMRHDNVVDAPIVRPEFRPQVIEGGLSE